MVCCGFGNSPLFLTAIQPTPNDPTLKAPLTRPQGAHELKSSKLASDQVNVFLALGGGWDAAGR